jgi:Aromatic-ring-opening dioxygenase LigAB, LigA subunit
MSLYGMQKFLFQLNREPALQQLFKHNRSQALTGFTLQEEERQAFESGNIGLLYVLGCNGQLLMHFAPILGLAWPDYIQAMRDGVTRYGPVRAGVYAMTTEMHEKVAGV